MLENLCLNKRKNKSAKFSENLGALSITLALNKHSYKQYSQLLASKKQLRF
jgi:hypothetical protein